MRDAFHQIQMHSMVVDANFSPLRKVIFEREFDWLCKISLILHEIVQRNKHVLFQEFKFRVKKFYRLATILHRLRLHYYDVIDPLALMILKSRKVRRMETFYSIKWYAETLYERQECLRNFLVPFLSNRISVCKYNSLYSIAEYAQGIGGYYCGLRLLDGAMLSSSRRRSWYTLRNHMRYKKRFVILLVTRL
jgi:hypothetical protein